MIQCVDVLEGLSKVESNSIDVVICDPPYNIGKNFGNNTDSMSMDKYVGWCMEWVDECERVMKDTSTLFIYGFSEKLCFLVPHITMEFKFLQWHYKNKAVPTYKFWQRSHESILCCWKSDERIFNLDDSRIPYSEVFLKNAAGKVRKGTKGRFSREDVSTIYKANEHGALPRDVIEIAALAGGAGYSERAFLCKSCGCVKPNKEKDEHEGHDIVVHPTQKPFKLTEILLKSCKPKEGGKVLIPFAGTGSECVVAKQLGMDYLGFEINPDYVKLAEGMIENFKHE